jgi:hypothetical protein
MICIAEILELTMKNYNISSIFCTKLSILCLQNVSFRSFFIGSCAGAKYGLDGIPTDWIARSVQAESVLEAAIKLVTAEK